MIVSGFTQRTPPPTDEDLQMLSGCHSHCFRCRQVNCKHPVDDITACDMMSCHACGWRFHECKAEEHTLTCQEERVACINALYGCPHLMKRSALTTHLPVCPASVVCCGEEWSRWPMHAREKGIRHSLPPTKTYIDCGQLDVGLAMRDQRMLIDSLRAPPKLKRTLRNLLTQKYPAAPITDRSPSLESDVITGSADTSQTVSDDDTDAPWDLSRRQPGLRDSISSHLVSVSKETKDSLMSALKTCNASSQKPESSPSVSLSGISEEKEESCESRISQLSSDVNTAVTIDAIETRESSVEKKDDGMASPHPSLRSSVSSERGRGDRSRSVSVLHDMGGSQLHKILGVKIGDENEEDISLHKILGVSLMHDVINKYVIKPASMYTFICAQNFRRDQYKWHFKNVHNDIISQQEYLEHRCPLAYAGCPFSFQRLIPSQPDSVLYFSWLQESFGLKSLAQPFSDSKPPSPNNDDEKILSTTESTRETTLQKSDEHCPKNENQMLNSNSNCSSNSNTIPSLSNLGDFDRKFDQLTVTVDDSTKSFKQPDSRFSPSSSLSSPDECGKSQTCRKQEMVTSVQPVIFTACNPDSKVLLVYNVEESCDWKTSPSSYNITDLPFIVIQQIARGLDSFSLCNLSLTCRLLRDVCCSLLDDLGIVMLNWERQKIGDRISWKVANKRWIFSTSFEPITSWKFNDNHVTITDHLKVCPYNQDKLSHTGPLPILK